MLRAIGSIVLGYLVMFVTVFVTFSISYLLLGTEGAIKPESYDMSALWMILSIVLSSAAAVLGGFVCAAVAKGPTPPKSARRDRSNLRPGAGGSGADPKRQWIEAKAGERRQYRSDATRQAANWMALLNPFIGAAGALVGARRKRGETHAPIM